MNNDRGWNPSNPIWDEVGKKFSDALDDLLRDLPHPTSQEQKVPVVSEPSDTPLARLISHPSVILIIGHRGSGKSALACRVQELKRDIAPCYAVGVPERGIKLLPDWYGYAEDAREIPPNAIIYIPESYRLFHARSTQSFQGRAIGDLVNLSRHRRHTLIFDVQNPAHLDRNIISEADIVLVKEPGPLTQGFERPQLRPLMDSARAAFAGVGPLRRKRAVWVYAPMQGEQGRLMENLLPTFWTAGISRIFAQATFRYSSVRPAKEGGLPEPSDRAASKPRGRKGVKTSGKERREKAKRLRLQGHSFTEIGRVLGVGKSQAFRLVKR